MKVSTLDKICGFLGELIGTGLLVFLGCLGCVSSNVFPNTYFQMTFNFGLVVMIIVQVFGHVSGAHLNPSVTLVAYIYQMISLPMAGLYVVAQCVGAFIGYGLLKILLPPSTISGMDGGHGLCVTVTHSDITAWQGFGVEFIITSVLALVCCGVWDPRNSKLADSIPIKFGLTISCLAITAGSLTGGSMNPARSFAPALWNYDFTDHWVYWFAPLSGAAITTILYKSVFWREVQDNKMRGLEEVPLS